jgi:hypothetical protein
MSEHLKYARSVDWKINPLDKWKTGTELRVVANMVMADLHCAVLFWKSEGTLIYNKKYAGRIEGFYPCIGESVFIALKDYREHVSLLRALVLLSSI